MLRFLVNLCALILLIIFTGCGKASGDTEVTLQLNWKPEPQFGGFYAADYAKHGLNVTVSPGGASAPTVELLGAGKVPFAVVSADEIPKAREQGIHVVALFAVYQTHPQGLMTHAKRGFKSIADVFAAPGTLALEAGLPYSDFLKAKYGFDKLKIVPSPFGDLSVLRTDDAYTMQCFVTSEPLAAKKAGLDVTVFPIADSGYNPYATVLATTDEYVQSHPLQVAKLIAAVTEGWTHYLADPAATNAKMHTLNPTMDDDTFAASAAAQKPLIDSSTVGSMTHERWQTLVEQLRGLKVLTGNVNPDDCFMTHERLTALAQ